jgi:hypothetical protein
VNGNCSQGACTCFGNWIGTACDTAVTTSNTTINTTSPIAQVAAATVSFTIAFSEVREVTSSGKTVKSFPIALTTIATVKTVVNGSTSWNYSIPLSNGAYVLAAFTTVNQTTDINFSNQTFTLLPNVLKSSISIFQYPFAAYTNKLYVVFSLGSNATGTSQVSNTNGQIQLTTSDGRAQYASYNMGGTQLVAKFLSYGVVDATSIIVQTSIDTSKNQFLMILPHFTSHGLVDPDFAVSQPNETSSDTSTRNRHHHDHHWRVVVGTTVGILVGGFVISMIVFAAYKLVRRTKRMDAPIAMPDSYSHRV